MIYNISRRLDAFMRARAAVAPPTPPPPQKPPIDGHTIGQLYWLYFFSWRGCVCDKLTRIGKKTETETGHENHCSSINIISFGDQGSATLVAAAGCSRARARAHKRRLTKLFACVCVCVMCPDRILCVQKNRTSANLAQVVLGLLVARFDARNDDDDAAAVVAADGLIASSSNNRCVCACVRVCSYVVHGAQPENRAHCFGRWRGRSAAFKWPHNPLRFDAESAFAVVE